MVWVVDDIEAVVSELKRRGVVLEEVDVPGLRTRDGIADIERIFSIDDLAPIEVIVAATGVSNGDLLRGVRYGADSARTHSLVMCTRCNWVRFVDGTHFFARERREEVRLL